MLLAIDVYYYDEDKAKVAGVLFNDWADATPQKVVQEYCSQVANYQSGQFYKRELPCIMQLLKTIEEPLHGIIIDGYVNLGKEQKAGLGMHLYNELTKQGKNIPIIGVAKKQFIDTPPSCEIIRGKSHRPLYISAVGISLEEAKSNIKNMHGANRLPTLLKEVDRIGRLIQE